MRVFDPPHFLVVCSYIIIVLFCSSTPRKALRIQRRHAREGVVAVGLSERLTLGARQTGGTNVAVGDRYTAYFFNGNQQSCLSCTPDYVALYSVLGVDVALMGLWEPPLPSSAMFYLDGRHTRSMYSSVLMFGVRVTGTFCLF